jgi:tetratricopeptide (TPR) repeat protein
MHQFLRNGGVYLFIAFVLLSACNSATKKPETSGDVDTTRLEYKLKLINDRIITDPGNAALYVERALINNARGVMPAAINDMKQAVSLDSTKQDYFLLLGDFAFRGLQVNESVDAFRKCIALDPSNKEANLKFAELNLYLKAYPDALKYANDALKLDERQAKPYFIKGFVYKEMKDTARAISSFQTVVEIDPEHYEAYLELGRIFAERGNPLAVQYYDNALRVRPGSTEALYNRGLFLQQIGRIDQAELDYTAIVKMDKQYADAYFNLGYISLIYRNEAEKSIGWFTDAIRINPDYVEAYYNRGMAFKLTGNSDAAKKDFMKALSIYPAYKLAQDRLKEMGVN